MSSSDLSTSPPSYPPHTTNPPTYQQRPAQSEDILIPSSLPRPDGVYTKRTKHFALALPGQERTVQAGEDDDPEHRPIYGRGATIAGVLEVVENSGLKLADILSVKIKVQGKLKLEIAEGGQSSQRFLDHTILLHPSSESAPSRPCPSMLPFSYALPTSFEEEPARVATDPLPPPGLVTRQLPPTYCVSYDGIPGIRAEVKYSINVHIERKVFWNIKKKQVLRIPFTYVPRARPHVPGPPPDASFVAVVKQAPEDWSIFVNDVPRRNDPTDREAHHVKDTPLETGETITSALVIPSSQTFPLTQAIPFHLQLSVAPSTQSDSSLTQAPQSRSRSTTRRPLTAPASYSNPDETILSLFSEPTFSPPPPPWRRRPPENRPIVGVGEGMAGDGTMYGDPRYANSGRATTDAGSVRRRRAGSAPASGRRKRTAQDEEEQQRSYVRVFLQRQIVVVVKSQKVVKTIACGDGVVHRVRLDDPPAFDEALRSGELDPSQPGSSRLRRPPYTGGREGIDYIAWEGKVQPSRDILTVGGFRTSGLWVKDFITLTMIPPDPEHSPLRTLHHAVPVKLVTDPWEEEWWNERRW